MLRRITPLARRSVALAGGVLVLRRCLRLLVACTIRHDRVVGARLIA